MFPVGDKDACRAHLIARRWPEGVKCPRCGNVKVFGISAVASRDRRFRQVHHRRSRSGTDQKPWFYIPGLSITPNTNISWGLFTLRLLKVSGASSSAASFGTFHNVSKKCPHLYIAEFRFRYNNRFNDDIFGTAIEGC